MLSLMSVGSWEVILHFAPSGAHALAKREIRLQIDAILRDSYNAYKK